MNQQTTNENIQELTITRVFNANRELVFKMWTEPEHLSKWYGPKGFSVAGCEIDLKPNGAFNIDMKRPDGQIYPTKGVFREISPPEKLVFSLLSHFDDQNKPQVEMLNNLTFIEENGKTKMTMHIVEVKTISGVVPLKGLDFAWNQSFDKLSEALSEKIY